MEDGYNFQRLSAEIIRLSVGAAWDEARLEWHLWEVYQADEPETCLCGHHPIIEICTIKNSINGKLAEVGNVCVDRFLGLETKKIFDAVKRVKKDTSKALNAETIVFFHKRQLISTSDKDFYLNTWRKRKLTAKQEKWRVDINDRVIARLGRANI